jgi:hypothetical protein
MVKEATKCAMDLPAALERTVRGKVKPSECLSMEGPTATFN